MHIRNALRFSLIVLFALAAPLSGAAEALIRLAFGAKFLGGADTLRVLVFGQIALALFVIVATVLSGAGKPAASALSALVALVVVLIRIACSCARSDCTKACSRSQRGHESRSARRPDRQRMRAARRDGRAPAAPDVRAASWPPSSASTWRT